MDSTISEKTYPIRSIWLFKRIIHAIFTFAIIIIAAAVSFMNKGINIHSSDLAVIFLPIIGVILLIILISVSITAIDRHYFHYSFEDHYINLHQGIFSKQNRNVPYGRIQSIFIKRGIFERLFGLSSLTFEDYTAGGTSQMTVDGYVKSGKSRIETLGFIGNKIHIPGLDSADAEALKQLILQKIKEYPIDDNQSGL